MQNLDDVDNGSNEVTEQSNAISPVDWLDKLRWIKMKKYEYISAVQWNGG